MYIIQFKYVCVCVCVYILCVCLVVLLKKKNYFTTDHVVKLSFFRRGHMV